jgi:molybdate-binding protein
LAHVKTEDTNPFKDPRWSREWGMDLSTRAKVKEAEAKGVVFTSERDRDHVNRERGKGPKRDFEQAVKGLSNEDRRQLFGNVRTKRPKKKGAA